MNYETLANLYVTPKEEQRESLGISGKELTTSMIFFGSCFWYFSRRYRADPLLLSRYVSSVHSGVVTILSLVYLFRKLPINQWHRAQVWTIGYLAYDLLLCTLHPGMRKAADLSLYAHHLTFLWFTCKFFPQQPRAVTMGYLSEAALPFLNWYFHYKNSNPSRALKCGAIATLLFPFCRLFNFTFGSYVVYHELKSVPGGCLGLILAGLNWFWYYKMLAKLYKAIKTN